MKRLLLALGLILALPMVMQAGPRDAQWKQVDEAINKGLPKTAIEALEPIIQGAMKDKAYGEAIKAIARKIVLEGNIQGNKPEEKIVRLEAEIAQAPKEMAPLLETVLANWYWQYFQQNRWRFMQRTATAQAPGKDFTTWDLARLFQEIDRHFSRALAATDLLKKTPIGAFDELLEKGTRPDACRPTLYDFIANEALTFYTSGEQASAKPEEAFEAPAESPILGSVESFLAWTPAGIEADSPVVKAIRLYQEVLRFHQKDPEPTAFVDVDLARLVYGYNAAFGEDKGRRYQTALEAFVKRWGDHEVSAMARHHWARVVQEGGDFVEARRLAAQAVGAFPASPGGKLCRNLVSEIEARSASITTERVWNAPFPTIAVHYRNVTNVYLRAVAYDWSVFLGKNHSRPENLNDAERKELMARAPVLAWSAQLPPTVDFKARVEELPAPTQLKPGFYFLVSSHKANFSEKENQIAYADVWVSDLSLVVRSHLQKFEGFVLQANSGEPIAGAEVMGWSLDNQGSRIAAPALATDKNGFFMMPAVAPRGYVLRVRYQGQELGSTENYPGYVNPAPADLTQTVFFTDRALYRPGQTIQYKGIVLRVDSARDNYEVVSGTKVALVFQDVNGKEIARAEHRGNDYGSFSGSFTAPRDRLLGMMSIRVTSGAQGATQVRVEEYKRPKFQVSLEPPKTAAKLGEKVLLSGKAESYTGAAVDGAAVKYRVVREVRWPRWRGWFHWGPPRGQASQEIAHGTLRAGIDGAFQIAFVAKPDPQVSEKEEASFEFSVYTDVTDTTGETRSAERAVRVGFVALEASLSAEDWQTADKPVEIKIATTTLDGAPQVAEGTVKIHRLKEPPRVQRPPLSQRTYARGFSAPEIFKPDLSDPNQWELAEAAEEKGFATDAKGEATWSLRLGAGVYRAVLETRDAFGKPVTARLPIEVVKPDDKKLAIKIPHLVAAPTWSVEPGQEFMALWGTGYETGRAFVEIEHRGQIIESYWTELGQTQQAIKRPVTEAMRGGFTLRITQVRENRGYLESLHVDVPWSNQNLAIQWEHFVSKLEPGQKETWTAVITGAGAQKAVAEMVATLYDASLDAYARHDWLRRFDFFRQDATDRYGDFGNVLKPFQTIQANWVQDFVNVDTRYRRFPNDLTANVWNGGFGRNRFGTVMRSMSVERMQVGAPPPGAAPMAAAAPAMMMKEGAVMADMARMEQKGIAAGEAMGAGGSAPAAKAPDLSLVAARKNLNETAFFFPQLVSDKDGVVRMSFTMPEALTQWRFMGFAHDRECRSGFLEAKVVTAKDLMVQPNPPRFLREGDTLEFTVKVSNQTAARQTGKVRLSFGDALSQQPADKLVGNDKLEVAFDIPSKESRSYGWRIKIPDGCGYLTYKAVGSTGKVSDGEEGFLPVLARRVLVTESLPLPIRGPATKKFSFTRLLQSGKSGTLKHQSLTVQMVSNPAWYAVLALPYLMEYPYECSEQTFNRFYANALARSIANSDPKIRQVFEQWKGTPALDSPLEKNQDLKGVMIEETPWLRQAQNESQARRNIGVLFDDNRLNSEIQSTLQKLTEMQLADGLWPWFPGGRGNDYITLYIVTGFGRLRHLGADVPVAAALKSLNRLDAWMEERYREILKSPNKRDYTPGSLDALYLYGRSFFLKDVAVAAENQEALDFFLSHARQNWVKAGSRQSQGHLAIALKRWGGEANLTVARAIMKSLKERAVTNEEMGMFWRDTESSWWWYRAPIETQALMIEAFDEVVSDAPAVEDCRVWLLKQKQTQDWKTTKATADAVYALLLRGRDLLASDRLVEVTLGGTSIRPAPPRDAAQPSVEAGTGFYEKRFAAGEVKAGMGEITVKKGDAGVAWGGVHWQYLEDVAKLTPYAGTPLQLKKSLYTKVATAKGPVLQPVKGALEPGDELVVRIELRVDRDLEYAHLKDQRGSGTEPVNVLSGYQYQDGLAYYESTRDTASHFFMDYLPRGTYVFEYSTRVQHRGQYQTGVAEIQCLYAPEFNSHSESYGLLVK